MIQELEIKTIRNGDTGYPLALSRKLSTGCPALLYYAGDLALLDGKYLAVVGSRDIDDAGRDFVEHIVKTAVAKRRGFNVSTCIGNAWLLKSAGHI